MSEETKTGIFRVSVTVLVEDMHFFSHTSNFPHHTFEKKFFDFAAE